VPVFYYLLHIPMIHVTARAVWFLQDGKADGGRLLFAPFVSLPEPDRWTLPLLYLVFFLVVATLYWPCRWFDGVKSYQRKGRLRYL